MKRIVFVFGVGHSDEEIRQLATPNHERVGKALALLSEGLTPFVSRECKAKYGESRVHAVTRMDPTPGAG